MRCKTITVDGKRVGLKNVPHAYARYLELQWVTQPDDMNAYGLADRYGDKTLLEPLTAVVTGENGPSEVIPPWGISLLSLSRFAAPISCAFPTVRSFRETIPSTRPSGSAALHAIMRPITQRWSG